MSGLRTSFTESNIDNQISVPFRGLLVIKSHTFPDILLWPDERKLTPADSSVKAFLIKLVEPKVEALMSAEFERYETQCWMQLLPKPASKLSYTDVGPPAPGLRCGFYFQIIFFLFFVKFFNSVTKYCTGHCCCMTVQEFN